MSDEPRMSDAEVALAEEHVREACCWEGGCRNDDCPLPRDAELLLAEVRALREERDRALRKAAAWQAKAVDAGRREIRAVRVAGIGFGRGDAT